MDHLRPGAGWADHGDGVGDRRAKAHPCARGRRGQVGQDCPRALDQFRDASSALRFHFGEVLLSSLVRAGVILLLGVPLLNVVVFETLLALSAMFHHSNVRLPPRLEKALSLVIVTPSIHWVHHHAIRRDTDSNYSSLLSVWDRLFRSRSATRRSPGMPIGTEGLGDRGLPGLIARPFEHR